MYGQYNFISCNGNMGHQNEKYSQGNGRTHKATQKNDRKITPNNSASSVHNDSPSSSAPHNQTDQRYSSSEPRYTKSYTNSQKRWTDKSPLNSVSTPKSSMISSNRNPNLGERTKLVKPEHEKVRRGSSESSFYIKNGERVNNQSKKPKPPHTRKHPTDKKENAVHNEKETLYYKYQLVDRQRPCGFTVKTLATPMYRTLLKSSQMVVFDTPDCLLVGSCWDDLSKAMWNTFMQNQQCEELYRAKIHLWEYLYIIIRAYYPRFGLYLVGSSLNGFGMESSDVDLCLMIHNVNVDQRNEALPYLNCIYNILIHFNFVDDVQLINCKVPLLKFRDTCTGLYVDMNCNNSVGMRNTHLLSSYSQMDWRTKPLVILVKIWAQFHNINDAKRMTLSSYSLCLMVIHFLQCGVRPAILPCLQKIKKDKFSPDIEIRAISINEEMKPYASQNFLTLGELLLRFFQYYSSFNFSQYAISVRKGSLIPIETCRHVKTSKNDAMQWKYICIEEPFDQTNTARSVHDLTNFQRIVEVFQKSAKILGEKKTLESILTRF